MQKKGFTLIELLIVVAIIGIIASIAIPNLLVAMQKSKQKATMSDMKSIGSAVEIYVTDWTFAPLVAAGPITNLQQNWFQPFYIKSLPIKDSWGTIFQYTSGTTANLDLYSIESWGRNHLDDGTAADYEIMSVASFNNEIIYSNGFFTVGPNIKR